MAEDFVDWKPMKEDFESFSVNSYGSGQTAAHLPLHLKTNKEHNIKLYIDGFPTDLTETGLKNFLNRIGCQFLGVKIMRSHELMEKRRPFAFIDFESTKLAQKAIQVIKNQKFFKLFVCFTSTETELKERNKIKDKEFEKFVEQVLKQDNQMKAEEDNRPNSLLSQSSETIGNQSLE